MAEPFVRTLLEKSTKNIFLFCRPKLRELWRLLLGQRSRLTVLSYHEPTPRLSPEQTVWINLSLEPDFFLAAESQSAVHKVGYLHSKTEAHVTVAINSLLFDYASHNSENYLSILQRLFGIESIDSQPRIFLHEKELVESRKTVARFSLRPKSYFVLNTSASNGETKIVPKERWIKLGIGLASAFPEVNLLFTGLPNDASRNREIVEGIGSTGCIDVTGTTDLIELVHLLAHAAVVMSGDTGPMHLAAALDIPTIAFFGPTSQHWTGPKGVHTLILSSLADCAPCMQHQCHLSRQICFDDLPYKQVFTFAKTALGASACMQF